MFQTDEHDPAQPWLPLTKEERESARSCDEQVSRRLLVRSIAVHDVSGQGLGEFECMTTTSHRARPWSAGRPTHQQRLDSWQGGLEVRPHLGFNVMREAHRDGKAFTVVIERDRIVDQGWPLRVMFNVHWGPDPPPQGPLFEFDLPPGLDVQD